MQGVSADDADMTGATFTYARMEGASLVGATLSAASLLFAQMQGVDLSGADLSNATLSETQLQGANLKEVTLTHAVLRGTGLYRAFIDPNKHKDTIFLFARARPTYPRPFLPGRRDHERLVLPEMLDSVGFKTLQDRALEEIQGEEVRKVVMTRLQPLDPSKEAQHGQLVSEAPINSDKASYEASRTEWENAMIELICEPEGAPHIARGFIYNGRIFGLQAPGSAANEDPALRAIATLREGSCAGARGLEVSDFRELTKVEHQILNTKNKAKTGGNDTKDDEK